MPKSINVTQFKSDIIKNIYVALDCNEISIYDTELVNIRNKAIAIIEVLNNDIIDLDELRRTSFYGIPVTNKTG